MAPKGNTQKRPCSAKMPKAKRVQSASKAKRVHSASKADPVQQQIDIVCGALADASYDVPGSQSCREMMMAIAPVLLKTLKDERNNEQDAALGMLGEIFETEEVRRQGSTAVAVSKMEIADKEWSMLDAATQTAQAELQAKNQEIVEKKAVLAADIIFVADTVKDMQDAENAKSAAEAEHQMLTKEKEMCLEVQSDSFAVLKGGLLENAREQQRHSGILTQLFKKLFVDKSLWAALPNAMGKQPADRSSFDILVVQQLEESLSRHMTSLEEKIANTVKLVTQKSSAVRGSQVVVEVIMEKRQASAQAVKVAKVEQKQLAVRLGECWQALTKYETSTLRQSNSTLWKSMDHLEQAQTVKGALAFLRERQAIPEPVVSEAVEESEPIAMDLSTEELTTAEPMAAELITETFIIPESFIMPEPSAAMKIKMMPEMGVPEPVQDKVMMDEPVATDLRIGGM